MTTVQMLVRDYLARFTSEYATNQTVEAAGRLCLAGGEPALVRAAQLLVFLPRGAAHQFSQTEAAHVLGLSRGYFCGLLGQLAARNILRIAGRTVRVADYRALKRIAAGDVSRLPRST